MRPLPSPADRAVATALVDGPFAATVTFFLPEARAYVARRLELGDYIPDQGEAALRYARRALCDAKLGVPGFDRVDLQRGRRTAELEAGAGRDSRQGFAEAAE